MRKITLKQIRDRKINTSIKFIASPLRFQKIAKALDNTSTKWRSGHKPTAFNRTLEEDSTFRMYYLSKDSNGLLELTGGCNIDTFNKNKYCERVSIK